LACAPAVVLISTLCLATRPTPAGVLLTETLRKVTSYGLAKPARELLFAHVSAEAKYKSKLVLDVVVQRMGDTMGAATFAFLGAPITLGQVHSHTDVSFPALAVMLMHHGQQMSAGEATLCCLAMPLLLGQAHSVHSVTFFL
jgi:ATP/ADP translocase